MRNAGLLSALRARGRANNGANWLSQGVAITLRAGPMASALMRLAMRISACASDRRACGQATRHIRSAVRLACTAREEGWRIGITR
ncbi:putative 50S ribosomal subunit protein L23 [Candidatus Tremblaya princeps]|uniref:Putative 50S ribosomal subunit protein L23 n=1 Tax=Tremblaya princeps TaxID=189385 RepID=A0A143WN95_TREPR|nr:putative 50S ribosomal subunit protein L23 [Candidatus Tremblaya princeps]